MKLKKSIIFCFQRIDRKIKKEIDEIANNSEEATFSNTIEALAYSGEQLDAVSSIFST
jgi:peptidyl-dipeptidase Dcp